MSTPREDAGNGEAPAPAAPIGALPRRPVFHYETLGWEAIERVFERDGVVTIRLDGRRAAALQTLMKLHDRTDAMPTAAPRDKLRTVAVAAATIGRLSLFHGRLFEVQRLAFELAGRQECREADGQMWDFVFWR